MEKFYKYKKGHLYIKKFNPTKKGLFYTLKVRKKTVELKDGKEFIFDESKMEVITKKQFMKEMANTMQNISIASLKSALKLKEKS